MIRNLFFCVCIIFPLSSHAQNTISYHSSFEGEYFSLNEQRLGQLLMADATITTADYLHYQQDLGAYMDAFLAKKHRYRTKASLVSAVFYKTHRKWLKRYKPFTPFGQMLKTGNYDCLSATTLYSYLFDELDIDHTIIENKYHIYILISTDNGELLIETTDPIYGFVTDPKEIAERLATFEAQNNEVLEDAYTFSSVVNESVNGVELIGLQYYNASVNAFNQKDYDNSIDLLQKAIVFRASSRYIEFGLLITQAILNDDALDDEVKLGHIKKVQRLLQNGVILASR